MSSLGACLDASHGTHAVLQYVLHQARVAGRMQARQWCLHMLCMLWDCAHWFWLTGKNWFSRRSTRSSTCFLNWMWAYCPALVLAGECAEWHHNEAFVLLAAMPSIPAAL